MTNHFRPLTKDDLRLIGEGGLRHFTSTMFIDSPVFAPEATADNFDAIVDSHMVVACKQQKDNSHG